MNFNIKSIPQTILRGCNQLIQVCADLKPNESALIISDNITSEIGECLQELALTITPNIVHHVINPFTMHGQGPPKDIARQMIDYDVIFGITKMSMAHTEARLNASQNGTKYLSLPDYSFELLKSEALLTDFRSLTPISIYLAELLTEADSVTLRTKAGTDLVCNIKGRAANPAPGWCYCKGSIASPPDAETNIAPIEKDSYGTIVVDGSIPCMEIGLLQNPLTLTVENGAVVKINGEKSSLLNDIFDSLGDPATRLVAEFGIGLNPKAKLCGMMLPDEGCLGTVHIGIGSNATIGGENNVPFHLDHVLKEPNITIDDEIIMYDGVFNSNCRALLSTN